MTIYDDLKPIVADIMSEFKQGIISLKTITPGAGPIDNPGDSTETVTVLNATVKGVSFKYIKEGFAVSSDFEVTAAPIDGVTVTEKDFITIDDVDYKIVRDLSTPAAGTKLAWKFIVRKGG